MDRVSRIAALAAYALLVSCVSAHTTATPPAPPLLERASAATRPDDFSTARREIYVGDVDPKNSRAVIRVFSVTQNGNVAPERNVESPFFFPPYVVNGIAFDNAGNMFVQLGHIHMPTIIQVYPPNAGVQQPPTRQIGGTKTDLKLVQGIDADGAGNVYASEDLQANHDRVLEWSPTANGNLPPSNVLAPVPQREYYGVAVNSTHLFLGRSQTIGVDIDVFNKNATKFTAPLCTIKGNAHGTFIGYEPIAETKSSDVIWASTRVYEGSPQTLVPTLYAYNGCGLPIHTIAGPNTGLDLFNRGIAEDSLGDVFTVGYNGGSAPEIRIFNTGNQDGDVTPNGVISGPATELFDVWSIAIGP